MILSVMRVPRRETTEAIDVGSDSTSTSISTSASIAAHASVSASSPVAAVERPRVVAGVAASFATFLSSLGIEPGLGSNEGLFTLVEREGRLDLRPPGEADRAGIRARFPPDRWTGSGARSPLVRAFGKKTNVIFDLTAGLGGDAYRLARAGYRVLACERNPVVYALLATGWSKDCEAGRVDPEVAECLEFSREEGARALARIDQMNVGVYVDPMYPSPRRTRSLPKRELQILRQLLGDAEDAVALVEAARPVAARVVVKRPHRAAPLLPDVSFEVSTKLVRFDVYVNPDRMEGGPS
jgi:16S rRNA (guanine1516-N2)-methyltransferase